MFWILLLNLNFKKNKSFFLCCCWNQIPDNNNNNNKSLKKRMEKILTFWYFGCHIWFFTWPTYFLFFFSYINQSIDCWIWFVSFVLFDDQHVFLVHYLCNAAAAVVVWPIKLNPSIHPVSIIIKEKKCSKRHTYKNRVKSRKSKIP